MEKKKFYTVKEVGELLGISRIAVFKRIKKGQIKARKIGRNYAIPRKELGYILGSTLRKDEKEEIDKAVKKTVADFGETLRLLGSE